MAKRFARMAMATLLTMILISMLSIGAVNAQAPGVPIVELETTQIDGIVIAEWWQWSVAGRVNVAYLGVTTGNIPNGDEARIHVDVTYCAGVALPYPTLGDLENITWDVYITEGYEPHVDILLDINNDGDWHPDDDDKLVAEYAYANGDDITNLLLEQWISTFEGASGEYPDWCPLTGTVSDVTSINGETAIWVNSQGPGSLAHTLADFQTPTGVGPINKNTRILGIEVEIDDWAVQDTQVCVDNLRANGDPLWPTIVLLPDEGISMLYVWGQCFTPGTSALKFYWDDVEFPVFEGYVHPEGAFWVRVVVQTQAEPGAHTITVTDAEGASASATFAVPDMTGPRGPKGTTGPKGATGPRGPTGPTGPQGESGLNGTQGEVGPIGPQGEQGIQGEQGLQGETGPQGVAGDVGPKGAAGDPAPTTYVFVGLGISAVAILAALAAFLKKK